MNRIFLALLVPFALSGCELLGIDDPVKVAEKEAAEGRAIGSGCRHSGRPLENCYLANKKASKAAIFAGWREMDGYMRENGIATASSEAEEAEPKAKEGASAPAAAKPAAKEAAPPAAPAETKAAAAGKKAALGTSRGQLT